MFFIILLREMERPLFLSWTNYPFPSGRCSCIQYCVSLCVWVHICVCVFLYHCVSVGGRGWIQGFPVEIIINHNMHTEPAINAWLPAKYPLLQATRIHLISYMRSGCEAKFHSDINSIRFNAMTLICQVCKPVQVVGAEVTAWAVHIENTLSVIHFSP